LACVTINIVVLSCIVTIPSSHHKETKFGILHISIGLKIISEIGQVGDFQEEQSGAFHGKIKAPDTKEKAIGSLLE